MAFLLLRERRQAGFVSAESTGSGGAALVLRATVRQRALRAGCTRAIVCVPPVPLRRGGDRRLRSPANRRGEGLWFGLESTHTAMRSSGADASNAAPTSGAAMLFLDCMHYCVLSGLLVGGSAFYVRAEARAEKTNEQRVPGGGRRELTVRKKRPGSWALLAGKRARRTGGGGVPPGGRRRGRGKERARQCGLGSKQDSRRNGGRARRKRRSVLLWHHAAAAETSAGPQGGAAA